MESPDVVIIGGGIVGLATAFYFQEQFPQKTLVLLEKEPELAHHQTGHNSGVLHSGIYYRPGSLKAVTCRAGKKLMEEFCRTEGISFDICGKVIVATQESEMPHLTRLFAYGQANGVECELIDAARLKQIEPHARGLRAILVRETGIIDYPQVCRTLAARITQKGNRIVCRAKVTGLDRNPTSMTVRSTGGDFETGYVINCAGLYSDRVKALASRDVQAKIIPFRGEYFALTPTAEHLCHNLIYPVPNPAFPFLGVHFTRLISGGVECGPNAVFAWAREGYRKTDVHLRECLESLSYPGFLRLAAQYWRTGVGEMWRSINKSAFTRALQVLVPEIRSENLVTAPAGVRAQAVSPAGKLLDDFVLDEQPLMLNVINAPSPAATASLRIGEEIVTRIAARFKRT